jgi:hypothetical protein
MRLPKARPLLVIRVNIAVPSLVRNGQDRALPCRTESHVLVALLRPICKQRAQPPQFLRPSFGRSGDTEFDAQSPKTRHIDCNEPARNLLPECVVSFLSDRNLAKDSAGLAECRPATERLAT